MTADAPLSLLAHSPEPLVRDPIGLLSIFLVLLALILSAAAHRVIGRFFRVVPAIVFCYFIPTALATAHVIPDESPFYDWVKNYVLPASLLLLTVSLDVPAILRLGPKAGIMFLAGTIGVIVGGPLALAIWQHKLPDEAWRTMSYLAGSWIGGSPNGIALQRTCNASDAAISPIIVVDVALANIWMGVLLFLAARHAVVDRWFKGDTTAIAALETKMEAFHRLVARIPTHREMLTIFAIAFGGTWLAGVAAEEIMRHPPFARFDDYLGTFAWKVIIVTTIGVLLSFTRARNLEGAGASTVGSAMIYLLIACIGAGADFTRLLDARAGYYLALGATWMLVHVAVILAVGRLIRAPFFFIAVGSQANIGGAASAPIVAGAFNPVLAPVGVLLAIAGYVLGTYGGLICVRICRWVAGAV